MCRHCKSNHPGKECNLSHKADERGNFVSLSPIPDYIKRIKYYDYRDYHKVNKVGWIR